MKECQTLNKAGNTKYGSLYKLDKDFEWFFNNIIINNNIYMNINWCKRTTFSGIFGR